MPALRAGQCKAISNIHSKDLLCEQDKYHEFQADVSKAYGVSTKDAHSMIENNDPRVAAIRRTMESHSINNTLSQIDRGKEAVSGAGGPRVLQSLNSFNSQHRKSIDFDPTQGVKERAESSGLNTETKYLDSSSIQQKVSTVIEGNKKKIEQATLDHAVQENIRQQQINKLEQNRIGQGA